MKMNVKKAKKQCDDMLVKNWDEIKVNLHNGNVKYDDLEKLLKYTFFRQFNNMFQYLSSSFEKKLSDIKYICKVANGWADINGKEYGYERFIPNKKYASKNRFNPPSKIFQYHGIGYSNTDIQEHKSIIITCLKEIRAKENSEVSICKFKVKESYNDKKIIDLTVVDKYSYDNLIDEVLKYKKLICLSRKISKNNEKKSEKEILKSEIEKNPNGNKAKLTVILGKIYMKMISEDLFLPVDGLNRDYEYASFHAFANYFEKKGYSGIIYNSTVNPGNKNLTLFNVDYTEPFGEITKKIYVNEILEI